MTVPFVDLQARCRAIKSEAGAATRRVLDASACILFAVTACGVGPGDEVLVPANTFSATAEAVSTAAAATPRATASCSPRSKRCRR